MTPFSLLVNYIKLYYLCHSMGTWSSGMILALGARGREFDSRSAPPELGDRCEDSRLRV
uniref:Uncharacterized protein n=1 Tax=Physcomitrium patens TaxID=3218 RepID=A0A2K1KGB8_PHYPA|nr:hypothetical protein PHYPA_009197 [Physcomitrium patens]